MTVNTSELALLVAASRFCKQTDELRDALVEGVTVAGDALVVRLRRLVVLEGEQLDVESDAPDDELVDMLELIDAWRRGERW